jgi:hypothetical protein
MAQLGTRDRSGKEDSFCKSRTQRCPRSCASSGVSSWWWLANIARWSTGSGRKLWSATIRRGTWPCRGRTRNDRTHSHHGAVRDILAPHYASTAERMQSEAVVLAVQDTTSLNGSR